MPIEGKKASEAKAPAPAPSAAVPPPPWSKADALYKEKQYQAASELLASCEQSVEVLWRRARILKSLSDASKQANEPERCKAQLYEALDLVGRALEQDDSHWACHKWYAIVVGLTSSYEGTRETIKKSFVIKEHFTRAAELNPLDATSRHLLGLWHWEVANLGWATRKIAAAVFASPPTSTYEEALSHFQLAEGTEPGFYIRNRLMIAKCHNQLRGYEQARKWAQLAIELPAGNHDDETAVVSAKQLLKSL